PQATATLPDRNQIEGCGTGATPLYELTFDNEFVLSGRRTNNSRQVQDRMGQRPGRNTIARAKLKGESQCRTLKLVRKTRVTSTFTTRSGGRGSPWFSAMVGPCHRMPGTVNCSSSRSTGIAQSPMTAEAMVDRPRPLLITI